MSWVRRYDRCAQSIRGIGCGPRRNRTRHSNFWLTVARLEDQLRLVGDAIRFTRLRSFPEGFEVLELLRGNSHLDAVAPFALNIRDVTAHTLDLEATLAVGGDGSGVEVVHAELHLVETHIAEE